MRTSTARARRARHCPAQGNKVRFRTHEDATRAISNIRRSGAADGPVRAYKCPTCAGWHLTRLVTWGQLAIAA